MVTWYNAVQSLHLLAVIAWMAAMLYLPRLFVYQHESAPGGEAEAAMIRAQKLLMRRIMTPAMLATFVFAIALLTMPEGRGWLDDGWLHLKLLLVLGMAGLHGYYAGARKRFEAGERPRTERHWRLMNEAPFVLLVGIVFLVVLKPWIR